jgi:hypothetical protein
MNVSVVITVAMVWWPFAVKRFWALWHNIITVATVMLLRSAYCVHTTQHSYYNLRIRSYLRLRRIKSYYILYFCKERCIIFI